MERKLAPKASVRLSRYRGGWQFATAADGESRRYRTNPVGAGLWQYTKTEGATHDDGSPIWEWRQIKAETEFWLNVGYKPTYDRIRYMLANGKL